MHGTCRAGERSVGSDLLIEFFGACCSAAAIHGSPCCATAAILRYLLRLAPGASSAFVVCVRTGDRLAAAARPLLGALPAAAAALHSTLPAASLRVRQPLTRTERRALQHLHLLEHPIEALALCAA